MAKRRKGGPNVHRDKYDNKSAVAQAERRALNGRFEKRQAELDRAARGKASLQGALNDSSAALLHEVFGEQDTCGSCGLPKWECNMLTQMEDPDRV